MIPDAETEELSAFRQACRRFAEREIRPLVDKAERDQRFPLELLQKAGAQGFLGLHYPEEVGGQGASIAYMCVVVEEFARVNAGLATPMMGLGLSSLAAKGSPEQVERYLRPALRGEKLGCFALTESEAGSDILRMHSVAEPKSGGGWSLRGSKMYITGAPISDFIIFIAYTDRDAGARGLSAFLVETDTPGVEVRTLEKLGHHSIETGEIFVECELPDDALIGAVGDGFSQVRRFLSHGRVIHAARSLGVARAAYELALEHAKTRVTFGQPLVSHQSIQFSLARILIEIESAQLQIAKACHQIDQGLDSELYSAMAKLVASEAAVHASSCAMQTLAGFGYMMESGAQRLLRDALLYPVSEGTTEIQLRTIARFAGISERGVASS